MTLTPQTPIDPPEIGAAIDVSEGVLWTRMPMKKPLGHVNCYLFEDDDGWSIVDTGVDTPATRDCWRGVIETALGGRPIKRVIVTHHHLDHIGLAGWFVAEFGAELITTRTAYLMARMLKLDVQDQPPEALLAFWRSCGMAADIYEQRKSERPFNTSDFVADLPLGYRRIKDGDEIRFGRRQWTVRSGDGHAPEHATFWSADGKMVIGGDQLLGGISPNLGVHATEPLADPVGDWLASCEKFEPFATPEQLVLTGHKLPYWGLPERLSQLITNHHSALDRLLADLQAPKTACDCFQTLFKRPIKSGEYGLAMVEAMAHCRYLEARGLASARRRDDGALEWTRTK